MKKKKVENKTLCEHCKKELLSEISEDDKGLVIKSRLIFLNEDGQVFARCKNCKKLTTLPLTFTIKPSENNDKISVDL
jgi:uncharacterized protein with PIN domain